MIRNTENPSAVQDAINRLTQALTPFGEGVQAAPYIDVRVSWIDASTADSRRFVPVVEVRGEQTYPLDLDRPA